MLRISSRICSRARIRSDFSTVDWRNWSCSWNDLSGARNLNAKGRLRAGSAAARGALAQLAAQVVAAEAFPAGACQEGLEGLGVGDLGELQEGRFGLDAELERALADLRRQDQEAEALGDRAARAADRLGDLLLGVAVQRPERLVALGLFEGVEVLALEVLDQGDLERLVGGDLELDRRDLEQPGLQCGAVAPFSGNDLELDARPSHLRRRRACAPGSARARPCPGSKRPGRQGRRRRSAAGSGSGAGSTAAAGGRPRTRCGSPARRRNGRRGAS